MDFLWYPISVHENTNGNIKKYKVIMRYFMLLLTLLVFSTSKSQEKSSLNFEAIKIDIIERLYKVEALDSVWVMNLKKEKYSFRLKGLQNGLESKELQIG